ncbi:MAG: RiPP maturation radical SAM C-methyltransferase, partial [Thermoplasmatales archaeon]|nr:RiPP maturation radical SAM C-methyltransferase [Thermoplasmatales archaeon]
MEMHSNKKSVLLVSMPFAETSIPSIQLDLLEQYLVERNIKIKSRHLYLKAAEFYGLLNYNILINSPNDSYIAQMVFSKYVFLEHWKKTKDKFKDFFNKEISGDKNFKKKFTFQQYIRKTEEFYNWIIENVDWDSYDLIGFTLNYGQLLPTLAISKKIKEIFPIKKIIFGGSRTIGELGKRILDAFEYVDFIVSGDGEDPLYLLASDYNNYESIPNLIYRKDNKIIWNRSNSCIDLNTLPMPSFNSYYEELGSTSEEIQQYFFLRGRLPVEISRGCWWNNCNFCNIGIYNQEYREKHVDRIIEEIQLLSDKYKTLTFQLTGNTLPKKDYKKNLNKIKELGQDFTFILEARAGLLKSDDYTLLKEAGVTIIQTGIETFSQNYLKKMNKGVRLIDNIAALKFCKENQINNIYNIITNCPNEEKLDFEETKKNIQLFKQYLDPPQISKFIVKFGSPIHQNPGKYNIKHFENINIDKIMFPKEFLEKNISYYYNFKRKDNFVENDWGQMVSDWKNEHEQHISEWLKSQSTIDKLIFYFV